MTVNVTLTGSGTIGPIEPGWAVQESCTPVALGDTSGSVGSATLDAASTTESVFAIDNGFTLTDTNLGTFAGTVVGAPITGIRAHLDVKGALGALVTPRDAGPMVESAVVREWGQFVANFVDWVAYADDLSSFVVDEVNSQIIKYDADGNQVSTFGSAGSGNGQFSTPTGIALDAAGNVWVADSGNKRVQKFTTSDGVTYTYAYKFGSSGSGNGEFNAISGIAFSPGGDLYVVDRGNYRVQKFTTADGGATYTYATKWGSSGSGDGQFSLGVSGIAVDSTGAVYVVDALLGPSSRVQKFTSTGTFVLKWTAKFAFGVAVSAADEVYVGGSAPAVRRYDTSGVLQTTFATAFGAGGIALNSGRHVLTVNKSAGTLVLLLGKATLSTAFTYYIRLCVPDAVIDFQAASDPDVIFPAWSGDVWSKLKELCAAYAVELAYVAGEYVVRDIGGTTLTIDNKTVPTITPSNVFGGRQVNIVVQNSTVAEDALIYTATDVLTVAAGQRWTLDVQTLASPVGVDQPSAKLSVSGPNPTGGLYEVRDATGAFVDTYLWADSGASVSVELIGNTTLRITAVGPAAGIAGFVGPFSFVTAAGEPEFQITGPAVVVAPTTLELLTGADPSKTTREVAYTVDSPFIDTVARGYDRGVWAAQETAGPSVTITLEVASETLDGFGVTPGALFEYADSKWRVTDCRFGNVRTAITATRHVTLGEVDTLWSGQSLGTYDTFWSGYSFGDQTIRPLAS